jgi:hypothetical protein
MESWNGRFKQENADLFLDAQTLGDLENLVRKQMRYYTDKRRHSSLGNKAPRTYVREVLSQEE